MKKKYPQEIAVTTNSTFGIKKKITLFTKTNCKFSMKYKNTPLAGYFLWFLASNHLLLQILLCSFCFLISFNVVRDFQCEHHQAQL